MKLPISALILAKNEEKTIRFCIAPLRDHVQEIIVCDTGSKDKSVAIARSLGAKVMKMKLNNDFAVLRNAMIEKASCPWLLQMDADSRIAPRDVTHLRRLISRRNVYAYDFPRHNYTNDFGLFSSWHPCKKEYPQEERFSKMPGYYLSSQILLFRKDSRLKYVFPVHESLRPAINKHGLRLAKSAIPFHHFELNKGMARHRRKHLFYLRLERKTIRRWPKEPAAYANLIRDVLFTKNNLREAEIAGKKLTPLAPGNADFWFLRALVAMCLKKWHEADRFISKSTKIKASGDNLCLKGWIELKKNRLDEAELFLRRTIQKKKDNPLALNLLGVLKERSNKPLEAIRYFTRAIRIFPVYEDALLNRAAKYEQTGQYKKALSDYHRLIALKPNAFALRRIKILAHLLRR